MQNPWKKLSKINPQREEGNRQISSDIFERLIAANLNGGEFKITLAIIHKTWGFHKTSDVISTSQLREMTGLADRTVKLTIKQLKDKRIIYYEHSKIRVHHGSPMNEFMFNKHYDTWLDRIQGCKGIHPYKVRVQDNTPLQMQDIDNTNINVSSQGCKPLHGCKNKVSKGAKSCQVRVHDCSPTKESITKETIQKKNTTRARARVSWIFSLAKEIVNEYPKIASELSSISSVYNLLTTKNDKVGQYPELYIQAKDTKTDTDGGRTAGKYPEEAKETENIVKGRACILRKHLQNYKKYVDIEQKENKYIIQSNNFFGRESRWREFGEEPKPPSPKKPIHHDGQHQVLTPDQEKAELAKSDLRDQYYAFLAEKIPLTDEQVLNHPKHGKEVSELYEVSRNEVGKKGWINKFATVIRLEMAQELRLPDLDQWVKQHKEDL